MTSFLETPCLLQLHEKCKGSDKTLCVNGAANSDTFFLVHTYLWQKRATDEGRTTAAAALLDGGGEEMRSYVDLLKVTRHEQQD